MQQQVITEIDISIIPKITKGTKKAWVRIYDPIDQWAWYICEYDGENLCYGLITAGSASAWTYFSIAELMLVRNEENSPLERDQSWIPREVG